MHRSSAPRVAQMRPLVVVAVALIAASAVGLWPAAIARAHPASAYCSRPFERQLLALINDYRVQNGLPRLRLSQTLGAAAEHYSQDMAKNNYTRADHSDLAGKFPADRMRDHGHVFGNPFFAGENVYVGFGDGDGDGIPAQSPREAFDWWKASPDHNANMLSANFRAIGIDRAYNVNSDFKYYWTIDFSSTVDAKATPC